MRGSLWRVIGLAALHAAVACGDDGPPAPADSGVGDGGADAAATLASPPAAPELGACREGWSEVEVAGVTACEAWPGDASPSCDAESGAFPSAGGCALVGSPCPSGDFSLEATGDDLIFVRPGGTGDGSRADNPLGLISVALSRASRGSVVALAKGRYDEPIEIPRGVTVLGACPGETLLTATTFSPSAGVVDVWEPEVVVRDITIGETSRTAVWAHMGASLTLENVIVRAASDVAIVASSGGGITASSLRVTGTVDTTGIGARGFEVGDGGQVEIRRAAFDDNGESAVFSTGEGTRVSLDDVAILATRSSGRGTGGHAVTARAGGTITMIGGVLEDNHSVAVATFEPGSRIDIDQVVIRRTVPETGDDTGGRAASAQGASAITLRRALIVDNMEVALYASATPPGTVLEASDVIVGRTGDSADGRHGGRGVNAQEGAAVTVERALFFENGGAAIFGATGSTVTLRDVDIRDMRGDPDGRFGRGISVQTGASLVVDRVRMNRVRDTGLYVSGPGATATTNDLIISDVAGRASLIFGRGLDVFAGATLEGARVVVDGTRDVGLHTAGLGSQITIVGASVTGTSAQECATTTCPDDPAGHGAGAYDGASLSLEDFAISGSAFCGAHVAGGQLVLRSGDVVGNQIGACVQTDGYDLELLRDRVEYRDNGTNLDTTTLPVPQINDDVTP